MQPLKMVNLSYILELQEFIWGDIKKKKAIVYYENFFKKPYICLCVCA